MACLGGRAPLKAARTRHYGKVIGIRYLRDLYEGSFTVKQRPVPCPHVPSVKGGWPHTANPLPTGRVGNTDGSSRTTIGDRLSKGEA